MGKKTSSLFLYIFFKHVFACKNHLDVVKTKLFLGI